MNKQVIILILVIGLAVLSGAQAIQINDLKSDIASGELNVDAGASQGSPSSGYSPQQSAPTMVGGC